MTLLSWQPMDTAPKGGGAKRTDDPKYIKPPQILLRFDAGSVSVGYWDWYYAEGGNGCTHGVAWVEPVSGEQLRDHLGVPIGWMPIPA